MANTLGAYDPIAYANEAMIWLRKALGFGSRVYRGYDPAPTQRGSVITIRRPMGFSAADMPVTATDLLPESVNITMDQWKGVTYALTDKELAYTKEQIVEEHIRPAAYAVALAIDTTLSARYVDVPWEGVATAPLAVSDLTAARKQLSINGAPLNDGQLYCGLSPTLTAEALNLSAFSQWQGAGQEGVSAQSSGVIGQKFGLNVFENQNVSSHTSGVAADATGALTAAVAKGATTLGFDAVTAAGTFKVGDSFVIAGNTQRYVFTANATADGGGAVAGATFAPAAVQAYADNDVITITLVGAAKEVSMVYHRDAFALAMGVLPDNLPGAEVFTVTDPSGLSLRARRWYDGATAKLSIGLDALWGVKTLNANLAYRITD